MNAHLVIRCVFSVYHRPKGPVQFTIIQPIITVQLRALGLWLRAARAILVSEYQVRIPGTEVGGFCSVRSTKFSSTGLA
jgi:hypothetical protein